MTKNIKMFDKYFQENMSTIYDPFVLATKEMLNSQALELAALREEVERLKEGWKDDYGDGAV